MIFPLNLRKIAIFLALFFAAKCVLAKDYRSEDVRANAELTYLEQDHTIRRALAMGRSTEALSTRDVTEIVSALERKSPVPAKLSNTWQKLLRISQTQSYLLDNKYFFPVGYEFETLHANHNSAEEFKEGSKLFQNLLKGSVGLQSGRTYKDSALMRDDANREWKLVRENVRPAEWEAGGYEFVSPPIRDQGELQDVASLAWRLGEKDFGKSNNMTGGHQTFTIVPNGETADAKMMGRMTANLQLLEAQYAPALFDILDIRRDGGVPGNNGPKNFFMRPIVMDHEELIKSLSKQDPDKITLADVKNHFFDKHVDKEFERTIALRRDTQGIIEKAEADELLKQSRPERAKLDKLWKYRDMQIKYNLENPAATLMETRIGDWVAGRPEQTMLKTLVYQQLISKAWDLSKEGKIYQPDIPKRLAGEADDAYWKRLQKNPAASKENFLKTIGVTDPDKANMILGKAFKIKEPSFRAAPRPSYGFEIEGWTDDLVELIVPNDPELRSGWDKFSRNRKLKELEKKGITIGKYSEVSSRRLGTEFKVDTARFPFMSPDIIVEDSGNWEVMSHGRNIGDLEALEDAIKKVAREIPGQEFGLHIHRFTPDEFMARVRANPKKFAKLLERQSLGITLDGYAEAGVREPHHAFDSWSLDRYSPAEIRKIEKHLKGDAEIAGGELKGFKYHNMAYRPVRGGLDNEMRDIGGDVDFGLRHTDAISRAIDEGDFGPAGAEKSPELFMEFRDHVNPYGPETKRYTLVDAVESRHEITEQQRKLLNKFQFEVYKPSMANYMYFVNSDTPNNPFWDHNDIPAKYLDPKMARANFENNIALPLLDYESQNYISNAQKAVIKAERENFADHIFRILEQVESDPQYKFMLEDENFLYLCDYLKRSTHTDALSIPFMNVSAAEATRRQGLLEELTYKLRGESVRFVRDSKANEAINKSLPKLSVRAGSGCEEAYRELAR
jgi:hypothetical protein